MDNKNTGIFIAERRKKLGYSQKDLAEKLNITDKAVSKWETGRSSPDVSMLIPLAEELEVSVTEILNGEKISEDKMPAISNEIIVKSLKKSKSKRMLALILTLVLLIGIFAYYPIYEYANSIAVNDFRSIESIIEYTFEAKDIYQYDCSDLEIKGDYTAYLYHTKDKAYMIFFNENKLFKSRMDYIGGTSADISEIGLYSMGCNGENIHIFFGTAVSAEKYCFTYRGVEHMVSIDDSDFVNIFIDKDNSYTNPHDWYFVEE